MNVSSPLNAQQLAQQAASDASSEASQLAQQAVIDANDAAAAMEQQAWDAASNSFLKSDLGKALKSAIEGAAGGAAALGAVLTAGPLASAAASALSAATAGAIAGSAVPIFGTVVGAMVGSIYALIKAFPPGEHGTWGGVIVPNEEFDQFAKFLGTEGFTKDAISKIKSKVPSSQWPLVRAWLYDSGNGSEFADAVAKGLGIPDVTSSSAGILLQASIDRAAGRTSYPTILNDAFQHASALGPDVMQAVKDQWPPYGHFASEKQPLSFPGVIMPAPSLSGPHIVTPTNILFNAAQAAAKANPPTSQWSVGPSRAALLSMTFPTLPTPGPNTPPGVYYGIPSPEVQEAAATVALTGKPVTLSTGAVVNSPGVMNPVATSIVAAAAHGNSAAADTINNATSAARAPGATPGQTALADALALAHKIQVHAQYVGKWFGTAAAQHFLATPYLTTRDLGT